MMSPFRDDVLDIELSGIAKIAIEGLGEKDVIPLWFGESDLVTPEVVRDAAKRALDEGHTFYSYARGRLALRQALQRYHQRIYGLDIADERIGVPGSTMLSVVIACQCFLEKGDEIIIIGPYWPNIGMAAKVMGAKTVPVRLDEDETGWHLDLDRVSEAIMSRTKAIYVNSPSNPTGWLIGEAEAQGLMDLCRRDGLGLISDEVYHRNVYEGANPALSFLSLAAPEEPVFVVNGFSKAWAMTGWRLGWFIAPTGMVDTLNVLTEINNTSATAFVQYGGVAALEEGESFLQDFVARCKTGRDTVKEILGSHERVSLAEPQGAFYAFPKIDGLTDSLEFARRCLREQKVGIAPGYTFGPGNDSHFRLCFAIDHTRLKEALHRIRAVIDTL